MLSVNQSYPWGVLAGVLGYAVTVSGVVLYSTTKRNAGIKRAAAAIAEKDVDREKAALVGGNADSAGNFRGEQSV